MFGEFSSRWVFPRSLKSPSRKVDGMEPLEVRDTRRSSSGFLRMDYRAYLLEKADDLGLFGLQSRRDMQTGRELFRFFHSAIFLFSVMSSSWVFFPHLIVKRVDPPVTAVCTIAPVIAKVRMSSTRERGVPKKWRFMVGCM